MPKTEEADQLDNWRFERMYNNLFCMLVEQGSHEDKWRYDPLDSKYPAIDGILRRERREAEFTHLPEFALVQLKGTRFESGHDPWPKLNAEFSRRRDGKPNPIEQVNSIASSCSALLIGLSVDTASQEIKAAYIGAPSGFPAERKPERPIEPKNLLNEIVPVLDALRPGIENVPSMTKVSVGVLVPDIRPVVYPRQKEIVYFNKQLDGMVSIGEGGMIFARNISINWTIPRGVTTILVKRISGSPVITAEPVALPLPPYKTHEGHSVEITGEEWQVRSQLPNVDSDDLWWVLQIRAQNCEATVIVEARA